MESLNSIYVDQLGANADHPEEYQISESVTGNNSSKCVLYVLKTVDIFLSGAEKK